MKNIKCIHCGKPIFKVKTGWKHGNHMSECRPIFYSGTCANPVPVGCVLITDERSRVLV